MVPLMKTIIQLYMISQHIYSQQCCRRQTLYIFNHMTWIVTIKIYKSILQSNSITKELYSTVQWTLLTKLIILQNFTWLCINLIFLFLLNPKDTYRENKRNPLKRAYTNKTQTHTLTQNITKNFFFFFI